MGAKLSYIKSLDGVRAWLCICIIIAHWKLAFPILPFGWETLQGFFLLSGFLITRILVYERDKGRPFKSYVKNFYLKRLFRIFPLYFGYLFLMVILRAVFQHSEFIQTQTVELKHSGVWLFTYLYNFKTWFNFHAGVPFADTPFFSHLWSLSVEEQFYMLFPFVVFFLRGKWLKGAVIFLIIAPQVLRMLGYPYLKSVNPDDSWAILLIYRNILFQIDSIALGAALAIFKFDWIKRPRLIFYALFASVFVFHAVNFPMVKEAYTDISGVVFDIYKTGGQINWLGYISFLGHPEILEFGNQYIYMIPLVNLTCFFMVLAAIKGTPPFRKVLEHKFSVYMGKISYGLYVFHAGLIVVFMKLLRVGLPFDPAQLPYIVQFIAFFAYLGLLVLVSHFSYNYFEMFFLKMKQKIK